jgi:hypothetical protein
LTNGLRDDPFILVFRSMCPQIDLPQFSIRRSLYFVIFAQDLP